MESSDFEKLSTVEKIGGIGGGIVGTIIGANVALANQVYLTVFKKEDGAIAGAKSANLIHDISNTCAKVGSEIAPAVFKEALSFFVKKRFK